MLQWNPLIRNDDTSISRTPSLFTVFWSETFPNFYCLKWHAFQPMKSVHQDFYFKKGLHMSQGPPSRLRLFNSYLTTSLSSYPWNVIIFHLLDFSSSNTLLFSHLHKQLHLFRFFICQLIAVHYVNVMCWKLTYELFLVVFFTRCATNWSFWCRQWVEVGLCLWKKCTSLDFIVFQVEMLCMYDLSQPAELSL